MDETICENLRETLDILDKEYKEIILVGEANCDFNNKKMLMQASSSFSTQNIKWNS